MRTRIKYLFLLILAASMLGLGPATLGQRNRSRDAAPATPSDVVLRPTADGSSFWTASSGTDRYAMVDEVSSDGDTTYISRADSSNNQFFNNLPSLPAGTILSVDIHIVGKYTGGGLSLNARITVNGTSYNSTAQNATTDYVEYTFTYATNPNTGSAWIKADVEGTGSNPLQAWGLTCGSIAAGETAIATQVWMVVRYN